MKCKALKKDGQPCRAPATSPDGYCFLHADPDRASRLGRLGGRKNRRSQVDLQIPEMVDAAALRDLEVQVLRAMASGEMNHHVATAFFSGCNSLQRLLAFIDTAESGHRVAELERRFAEYELRMTIHRCSNAADSELHREGEDTNTAVTAGTEHLSATSELRSPPSGVPHQSVTSEQDSSDLDGGSPEPDSDELEQAYDQKEDDEGHDN